MDYTHWLQSGPSGLRSPADLFGGTVESSADCISNPEVGADTREGLLLLDNLESRRLTLAAYTAKGRLGKASAVRRCSDRCMEAAQGWLPMPFIDLVRLLWPWLG